MRSKSITSGNVGVSILCHCAVPRLRALRVSRLPGSQRLQAPRAGAQGSLGSSLTGTPAALAVLLQLTIIEQGNLGSTTAKLHFCKG